MLPAIATASWQRLRCTTSCWDTGTRCRRCARSCPNAIIGPTMDPQPFHALDEDALPAALALDAEYNRAYLDPVFSGAYPVDLRADLRPPDALIKDGDLELISAPIDFFGLNYYRPHYVRSGDPADLRLGESAIPGQPGAVLYLPPELPRTVMGWPIVPEGLRDLLIRLHQESGGLPIYVTENGCAADDYLTPEGTIEDHERIEFIHGHLEAVLQAMDAGVKVGGYFHWSLMDNFEWAEGYRRRFGLHYVEFDSGRRVPKRSAQFYRQLALTGELPTSVDTPLVVADRVSACPRGTRASRSSRGRVRRPLPKVRVPPLSPHRMRQAGGLKRPASLRITGQISA